MKSREKPKAVEAVDAYVAVMPRDYYEFTAPPPTPASVPVARDTGRSRAAKIWRRLFERKR